MISDMKGLVFHFTILPKTLYVETRDVIVTEGGSVTLTTRHLRVITEYYADKIEDYLIVDPPAGGTLISTDSPLHPEQTHKSVTIFSVGELSDGKIRVSQ